MYPVEVAQVAATLGINARSMGELMAQIEDGFPRSVVRTLSGNAVPRRDTDARRRVEALVASPATLKRGPRLSRAASERAERLARIAALARRALGDTNEAKSWLTERHPLFGQPPIELAATDLGARQVERVLLNIEYSLPL